MLARAMEDDMIDDAESSGEDQDEEENEDDLNDDEEDEEGFTDLEDGAPEHSENQKKTSLYKAPTAEEMEQLRRQEEERGGHFGFAMKVRLFLPLEKPYELIPCRSMRCWVRRSSTLFRRTGRHTPLPPPLPSSRKS
jgi:hypothetical protein